MTYFVMVSQRDQSRMTKARLLEAPGPSHHTRRDTPTVYMQSALKEEKADVFAISSWIHRARCRAF